ncbi:MAG: hydantoinase/oxoprolinase family protein, partial [Amphiplicatus sp.]
APATGGAALTETRAAYMRYRGLGHEIAVGLPPERLAPTGLAALFEDAYRALYGRTIPGMEIEALTFALTLSGAKPPAPAAMASKAARRAAPTSRREAFDAPLGRRLSYGVFEREALAAGAEIDGPALIVEDQTTTVVTSVFKARVDALGHLILERKAGA